MTVRIDIPGEGVTVTPTCSTCRQPLARCDGWMSWRCDTESCPTRVVPMFEDARFVDGGGTIWLFTDDGDWIDVVDDSTAEDHCSECGLHVADAGHMPTCTRGAS